MGISWKQLPFLQHLLSDFRIVPILLQDDSPENVVPLSQAIAEAMADRSPPIDREHRSLPLSYLRSSAKIRSGRH